MTFAMSLAGVLFAFFPSLPFFFWNIRLGFILVFCHSLLTSMGFFMMA